MTTQRPIFLDIPKLRFPVMAIVSILHRITGVLIFLFLPLTLYLLSASLASPHSFYHLKTWVHQPWVAVLIWVMLVSITFHLFAGIRHLLMDCGFGENLNTAKVSAYIIFSLTAVCAVLLGVWLW